MSFDFGKVGGGGEGPCDGKGVSLPLTVELAELQREMPSPKARVLGEAGGGHEGQECLFSVSLGRPHGGEPGTRALEDRHRDPASKGGELVYGESPWH